MRTIESSLVYCSVLVHVDIVEERGGTNKLLWRWTRTCCKDARRVPQDQEHQ
jgi:hypothetical protein